MGRERNGCGKIGGGGRGGIADTDSGEEMEFLVKTG